MYKNLLYHLSKHNRLIQTIKLICNKLINSKCPFSGQQDIVKKFYYVFLLTKFKIRFTKIFALCFTFLYLNLACYCSASEGHTD